MPTNWHLIGNALFIQNSKEPSVKNERERERERERESVFSKMTKENLKDDATTNTKASKANVVVTKEKQRKPKSIAILKRLWKDAMEDKYSLLIGLLAMIGSAAANQGKHTYTKTCSKRRILIS